MHKQFGWLALQWFHSFGLHLQLSTFFLSQPILFRCSGAGHAKVVQNKDYNFILFKNLAKSKAHKHSVKSDTYKIYGKMHSFGKQFQVHMLISERISTSCLCLKKGVV